MTLRRFVIERDIPKVGTFEREQLRGAAAKSNEVLNQLGPDIQWVESFVADNKTFCIYLAKDEAIIRKHAEISGLYGLESSCCRETRARGDRITGCFTAVRMVAIGRLCCKSHFALRIKNSAGYRRGFRVKM